MLMEMGGRFYDNVQPDSALMCYNIVANRYYTVHDKNELNLKMEVSAMNQLGILYTHYFYDYEKAHRNLIQAKKIAQDNHFTSLLSSVYTNLGNIYLVDNSYTSNDEQNQRIIETNRKAFELALKANRPEKVVISAVNMAHIADDSVTLPALRDDIILFLRYQIPDSLRRYEYAKDYCRAALEQDKGNFEAAQALYDKTLQHVYDKNARTAEIIRQGIRNVKARLYIKMHQYQTAVELIHIFIDEAQKSENHHRLFIAYHALSEYYHNVAKDSVMGDRYELMALREKDIVLNQNKLLDAEKTEFLLQIDEINAEVQELSYRQRLTKIIAWAIAVLVLLVLSFLYLLWRRYCQEQEKNQVLYEKNQALLAADEERRQQIIEQQQAPKSHKLGESEQSDLLYRVLYVMETCDEVFTTDFTLPRLAELAGDTRNNVPEAINQRYQTNFNGLLNEYRIKEACRRINDTEHYGHLTIEAIGQSVGFKSNSNFVSNFKKITGLTPSAYRKQSKPQSPADSTD